MTHEELEEAVPLYAVGALERTERQVLETHLLSGCATCHAALKECQAVAAVLPFALPPVAPPRTLKAKIMAARTPPAALPEVVRQLNKPSLEPGEWMNHLFPPSTPAHSIPFRIGLGFASLALVAGIGYLAWLWTSQTTEESNKLEQLQAALQVETSHVAAIRKDLAGRDRALAQVRDELQLRTVELAELRDMIIRREAELDDARLQLAHRDAAVLRRARSQQEEIAALLRLPGVKVASLAGSEMARSAGAVVLFDPGSNKAWLYAFNLPLLPTGKVYQLWAIDDKPVSAGIFSPDAGQKGRLMVKNLPDLSHAKKFAVSLEPAGGRPQPTGAIYLVGQL